MKILYHYFNLLSIIQLDYLRYLSSFIAKTSNISIRGFYFLRYINQLKSRSIALKGDIEEGHNK